MAGPGIKIMPAVKANAYGHGIVESCRALEEAGADYLGVGNIDEAILLRENGIQTPSLSLRETWLKRWRIYISATA